MSEDLKPCPFPHKVTRGVYLDVDEDDFFVVRGACSDCGACGPFVNLDDSDRDKAKAEAAYLWNTRAPLPADKNAVERVAVAIRRQFNIDEGFSEEQADSPRFQEENANFHNCARAAIAALSGHGE